MVSVPSWDLFFGLFFIIGLAYGFILQREKIVVTLVSVYVALVVSQVFSPNIQQFFVGDKTLFNQVWIRSNTSPFTIQTTIFALVIILLTTRSGLSGGQSRGLLSPIEVLAYSFLNTGLILSSIFSFMPQETQTAFAQVSKIAKLIMQYHLWWIILPVALLIILGFKKSSE